MFPIVELALGAEGGDHHRHPRPDVGALESLSEELCGACDDGTMWVAEDDSGSHRDQLSTKKEPAFEHLLEHEHGAGRLGRSDDCDRGQVGGERPARCRSRSSGSARRGRRRRRAAGRAGRAGSSRRPRTRSRASGRRDDRDQIVGLDVLDRQVTPRHGREDGEARDLDVLRPDAVRAAAEPFDALDPGGCSSRFPRSRAPMLTRKRQRSWMCGSHAACPTIVSPSARTAAMIAFSVPITDASSRYMRVADEPVGAEGRRRR